MVKRSGSSTVPWGSPGLLTTLAIVMDLNLVYCGSEVLGNPRTLMFLKAEGVCWDKSIWKVDKLNPECSTSQRASYTDSCLDCSSCKQSSHKVHTKFERGKVQTTFVMWNYLDTIVKKVQETMFSHLFFVFPYLNCIKNKDKLWNWNEF